MNTSLRGLGFGDDGKGKIISVLGPGHRYIVRYHGGNNAGESYEHPLVPGEILVSHAVPILTGAPDTYTCFLGGGMIHVERTALEEIPKLEEYGIDVSAKTFGISGRNQVVLLHHLAEEVDNEAPGINHFGTTGSGISTGYAHMVYKIGMTFAEFVGQNFEDVLRERVVPLVTRKFGGRYLPESPVETYIEHYAPIRERLRGLLRSESELRRELRESDEGVLLSGCQSIPLDVVHGANRYSSSSGTVNLPMRTDENVGVMKIPMSNVQERRATGSQKWITFDQGLNDSNECRGRPGAVDEETGRTTGYRRDLNYPDAVLLKHGVEVGDIDSVAMVKADYLAAIARVTGGDFIPVCTAYRTKYGVIETFPDDSWVLEGADPVYRNLEFGPDMHDTERLREMREFSELDPKSQGFFNDLGELIGAPIEIISTGPLRDQTIRRT